MIYSFPVNKWGACEQASRSESLWTIAPLVSSREVRGHVAEKTAERLPVGLRIDGGTALIQCTF